MPITYPTIQDLYSFLSAAGIQGVNNWEGTDAQDALNGAIAAWEEQVGWEPFLSSGNVNEARRFSAPGPEQGANGGYLLALQGGGRTLFLPSPLLTLTSLTAGGVPYGNNSEFYLYPLNAVALNRPYTSIEFVTSMFSRTGDLVITGEWGFISANAPSFPANAKRAILSRAAADLAPQIGLSISGGMMQRRVGDVEYRFAGAGIPSPLAAQEDSWRKAFQEGLRGFKPFVM